MTDKETNSIKLPVFNDREFTDQFNKQTIELSAKLVEFTNAWLLTFKDKPEEERPSAYAVGAAFYAALWTLSQNADEDIREQLLRTCATTLLKNDTAFQLLITQFNSPPN